MKYHFKQIFIQLSDSYRCYNLQVLSYGDGKSLITGRHIRYCHSDKEFLRMSTFRSRAIAMRKSGYAMCSTALAHSLTKNCANESTDTELFACSASSFKSATSSSAIIISCLNLVELVLSNDFACLAEPHTTNSSSPITNVVHALVRQQHSDNRQ